MSEACALVEEGLASACDAASVVGAVSKSMSTLDRVELRSQSGWE
jgi:hypothetical protein